jgi:hypothetical protein
MVGASAMRPLIDLSTDVAAVAAEGLKENAADVSTSANDVASPRPRPATPKTNEVIESWANAGGSPKCRRRSP